ncbi:DUF502 domain-containing protein [Rubinisphaera margarita]|uniref:DUF502 domain-containing protein n=1 Tax=Rubinisphaera margarita TaxID=2909586 RepID=UPI001EE95825|nr:DUF502 domain-containing protein [Rubinisphaera margarita]MCG6157491.1 DUF502 domain-containing protein [Rubinisphaera margarita]
MKSDRRRRIDTPASAAPHRRLTAGKVFLRGLAIILPSVLTLVILLWLVSLLYTYIIKPTNTLVMFAAAQVLDYSHPLDGLVNLPTGPVLPYSGRDYRVKPAVQDLYLERLRRIRAEEGRIVSEEDRQAALNLDDVYVPVGQAAFRYGDYLIVAQDTPLGQMPRSRTGFNMELIAAKHFPGLFPLSMIAVCLLLLLIYLLGRIVTVRLGGWFVHKFESLFISSLPVVRHVYGSVKQVTDFLFSENQIEVRKVVAFEYPRKGIWSLGFVTGESLLDVSTKAGEPCISILVPTSPMPMTGYTMSVPKSETVDLDLTVDQAFQYIVSCGVLVPPHQRFTPERFKIRLEAQETAIAAPPVDED